MAKFKKYSWVQLKDEALKELGDGFPIGSIAVTGIEEREDGAVYELYRQSLFNDPIICVDVKEEWLEQAKSPAEVLKNVQCSMPKIIIDDLIVKPTEKTVSILGTTYTIVEKQLKDCDGYCDKTTKEIAVAVKEDDCDLGNFEEYWKKVLRHEITHAYFFESGLAEGFENVKWGVPETLVDWFAYQSPKIFKTFEELDIL